MAQPTLPASRVLSAPPGFAAICYKKQLMTTAATSSPAAATTSLNLEDVTKLAAQEKWQRVLTNHQHSVVSFCVDRSGETIRVNVFFEEAIVGIVFSHPRMGQTQSFRSSVDLSELRKIFRDPRVHTGFGYSNPKKQKSLKPQSYHCNMFAIGDNVLVRGYGSAIVVKASRYLGDMIKIRFPNGSAYRVAATELSHIDNRCTWESRSLRAEAESQLKRLDYEVERIKKEQMKCKQILQLHGNGSSNFARIDEMNINQGLRRDHPDPLETSPTPRAVIGAVESFGAFEPYNPNKGSNRESIWYHGALNQGNAAYLGNGVNPSASILPPFFPINQKTGQY